MSKQHSYARDESAAPDGRRRRHKWWLLSGAVLLALMLIGSFSITHGRASAENNSPHHVSGAGRTIIEGGTGGATPLPVTTTVAFHADGHSGDFECLALAPAAATGPGSGAFTANAMYVTGKVTSVEVEEHTAILSGSATVTGLGAGQNTPFKAQVSAGGPGATVTLQVSGLTFHEILLEGQITVG
jgi:hypothetical protein